jgi:hypothetical protein
MVGQMLIIRDATKSKYYQLSNHWNHNDIVSLRNNLLKLGIKYLWTARLYGIQFQDDAYEALFIFHYQKDIVE